MPDIFQTVLPGRGPADPTLDVSYPFYPLTAAGMPLPGENFLAAAGAIGDEPPVYAGKGKNARLEAHGPGLHYLYRRALYDENFVLNVNVRGQWRPAPFVPGHLLGSDTKGMSGGPMRAKVMIIGKNPGRDEVTHQRNLVGPTSMILFDALDQLGVGEAERNAWYITNLVKWPQLDTTTDTLPIAHKKDCHVLLEEELRLVRPDYVLCLGSDAAKWLLGTSYGVTSMVGRCVDYAVPIQDPDQPPMMHRMKVMAVAHPAAVYRRPEMFEEFKNQIGVFLSLCNGADVGGKELWVNHREVYKHRELKAIVDEIRADPDPWRRVIALDGEWNGLAPGEPGAYLRTIQFSSKHGEGITVVLRHQGGEPAFTPSIGHAIGELSRLCKYDPEHNWIPRIGGHFFRSDLPWFLHEGLDLREEYAPAPTHAQCRFFGGWDTGLMYHAYNESTSYRLTDMQVRLTTAPVYDTIIKDAITGYCKEHDIKKDDLEGYGFLPAWKLHPYACYDPDVTRRIAVRCLESGGLLDKDWFNNQCWEPFWVAHRASLGFLEMEMHGLLLDKPRVDKLTSLYEYVYAQLLARFRQLINWEEIRDERGRVIQGAFNPNSAPQAAVFLFGDGYARKVDKESGGYISPRPASAVTLNLTPIKSTGKRPRLWSDLVSRGEDRSANPSTDKEVLGILGHHHPLAMQLRDLKFVSQILKGPLRRPNRTDEGTPELDFEGNQVYDEGLASYVLSDGRLHTHLSQNKETGRAASARPPLQNISSRREDDYARILGFINDKGEHVGDYRKPIRLANGQELPALFPAPLYCHPIRSIFCAAPGHVLIAADYTGAEIAMLAWLSGDTNMIEHVRRNALPESHRDYLDIHSDTAVRCFHLDCPPTKKGLKSIDKVSLRVAAKNVRFGIPYGRSAEAIARQCREEGTEVSTEACQHIIDFFFSDYPQARDYLRASGDRAEKDHWLAGTRGRFRRFIASRERSVIAEQRRQGQNFGCQNGVADSVSDAIFNLTAIRGEVPDVNFHLALQMHDALLCEVPVRDVQRFIVDKFDDADNIIEPSLLRLCMVNRVPVWPRTLDNRPIPMERPYHFGIDSDIYLNWGEPLTPAQAESIGLDPAICA